MTVREIKADGMVVCDWFWKTNKQGEFNEVVLNIIEDEDEYDDN